MVIYSALGVLMMTVDEKLDCKKVGGWCACVAWVVYFVAPGY
jgi:hypothetical protein